MRSFACVMMLMLVSTVMADGAKTPQKPVKKPAVVLTRAAVAVKRPIRSQPIRPQAQPTVTQPTTAVVTRPVPNRPGSFFNRPQRRPTTTISSTPRPQNVRPAAAAAAVQPTTRPGVVQPQPVRAALVGHVSPTPYTRPTTGGLTQNHPRTQPPCPARVTPEQIAWQHRQEAEHWNQRRADEASNHQIALVWAQSYSRQQEIILNSADRQNARAYEYGDRVDERNFVLTDRRDDRTFRTGLADKQFAHDERMAAMCRGLSPASVDRSVVIVHRFDSFTAALEDWKDNHNQDYRNDFPSEPATRPTWIPAEIECMGLKLSVTFDTDQHAYGVWLNLNWVSYDLWDHPQDLLAVMRECHYTWVGDVDLTRK